MKKNILLATALAITALAGCTDDSFVGDQSLKEANGSGGAITFNMGTPAVTRATGSDAADLLNNNFVVYGYKTVSSSPQVVFDNYQVNWVNNTAGTTESNSANWEYVSYKNLPNGVGTNTGVTAFAATTTGDPNNSAGVDQSIKYWDFSATAYDFFAYSLGDGSSSTTWAKASALNKTGYGTSSANPGYTLEGTQAELGTCYISNKKNVVPSTSATQVNLEFRSFLSQIQLMFYETIPGYSVKSLSFYPSAAGTAGTTPYLFASDEVLPTEGKYTVTFDTDGKAQVELASSDPTPTTDSKTGAFSTTLTNYKGAEYKEDNTSAIYLGRASNDATKTDIITMLPNPDNANALNLKIDFTLVSRDGTGETINMTGATAVIPSAYAKWKPNYKYTYIFKISDNTNAKTAAITGLYPITLDATVTDAVDGTQETITTVDDPSITTYAKGTMVTANNEYLTGANIYIVVNDGVNITAGSDAKLYTAAITLESVESPTTPRPAAQGITEETVANALAHSGSVTDANGATLTVTLLNDGLTDITEIDDDDAPDGYAITVDGVMFTPASAGNYVFEYSVAAVNYDTDGAAEYNAALTGALPNDGTTGLTAGQATAYNATLTGAIAEGTALTGETLTSVNALTGVSKTYTEDEEITAVDAALYNAHLSGAKAENNTITIEQANTYNATLPGAVAAGNVKTPAANHYKVIKVVAAPEP